MKKKIFLIICLIILVLGIVIVVVMNSNKEYTLTYEIDGSTIIEQYNKEEEYYLFTIKYKDVEFTSQYLSKRFNSKKLIKELNPFETEDTVCLGFISDKITLNPLCNSSGLLMDISFAPGAIEYYNREKLSEDGHVEGNIEIFNLQESNILIWDYNGYYFLSNNKIVKIDFLKKENYYNNLAYQTGEYVITPNYDSNYTFNNFYIINIKKGKLTKWDIDADINFNSYYLGSHDGIIYLFDRKEKTEYSLNPKKKKIEIVSANNQAKVWSRGWESISTTKLANDTYTFTHDMSFSYEIKEDGLYQILANKKEILISRIIPSIIVKSEFDKVYFLSSDTLYCFSYKNGLSKMITYPEWNFNYSNSIYIY